MAPQIPEDQIRHLLQRAAELQHATDTLEQPSQNQIDSSEQQSPSSGYDLKVLQDAAGEVGISANHILMAAAEMSVLDKPYSESLLSKAMIFLHHTDRSITVTTSIQEPPKKVLQVLTNLAPSNEFKLKLLSVYGEDPITDGILIYKTPSMDEWSSEMSKFVMGMYYADLSHLFITIRQEKENPSHTLLTIHGSLGKALKLNYYVGKGFVYGLGGLSIFGVALLTAFNPLATVALGLATGAGVGFGTHKGYQWLYAWGLKKGKQALEMLAQSVATGCKALSWQ